MESHANLPAYEVTLAPFQGHELESIAELARACAARPGEALPDAAWAEADTLDDLLASWPVSAHETLWVASHAGRPIAFCGAECHPRAGIALIHGPLVDPPSRERGVGRALLDHVVGVAARNGAEEIWTVVAREAAGAQVVLERAGFERAELLALFRLERSFHVPLPFCEDLRRAGPGDLQALLALHAAIEGGIHLSPADLTSALDDPEWRVWVAGGPDGLNAIAAIDGDEGWVGALAVHPRVAGSGAGAAVLSAALEDFWLAHPRDTLGLTVHVDSISALAECRRLGFTQERHLVRYVLTP